MLRGFKLQVLFHKWSFPPGYTNICVICVCRCIQIFERFISLIGVELSTPPLLSLPPFPFPLFPSHLLSILPSVLFLNG